MDRKKTFRGTDQCGLCRLRLPTGTRHSTDATTTWQFDFRAAVLLDWKNKAGVRITDPARLLDFNNDVDVTLNGPAGIQTITIRRSTPFKGYLPEVPDVGPAFCFHDWCYSILMWRLGGCPKSIIYMLARTLLPDVSRWETVSEERQRLEPKNTFDMLITLQDQFLSLLYPQFMRLPPEISSVIWKYVGSATPFSAFLIVAGETSRLAHHLRCSPSRKLELVRGSNLGARMVTVFGTEYIQDFLGAEAFREDQEGNFKVLGEVTGTKVIASVGGICAIKVLGVDWETDWIGKVPTSGHIWYGTEREVVPFLHCSYNDLNCIDISSSGPSSSVKTVWDQPNVPSMLGTVSLNISRWHSPEFWLPNAQKRHFLRYISLYNESEHITGLTVYMTTSGIVGLESHFTQTSELSGLRSGCALYFTMHPDERIVYVWLRRPRDRSLFGALPALLIQTSFDRMHSFGHFLRPEHVEQKVWTLLRSPGSVSGFSHKNNSFSSHLQIRGFGVTSDGIPHTTTPQTPRYHVCNFPGFGYESGLFLSVAVLSGFQRIDVCRVGDRCTGVLIHYNSGLSTVLGQWYTRSLSQHSCLWSGMTRSSGSICFEMTTLEKSNIVTDILFSDDGIGKWVVEPGWQVFDVGSHISWWFSEFFDEVSLWEGETHDVPKQCLYG